MVTDSAPGAPGAPPEPAIPPLPGGRYVDSAWRWVRRWLAREDRLFRVAFSLLAGFVFTLVLLEYTQGGLLYGIDYPGVYSWQDFFARPRTDYVLPGLIAGLFGTHLYAAFYATLFAESALVVFALQSLARALLRRSLAPIDLRAAGAVAGVLYLASPVLVTYRYVSLIQSFVPSSAAFIFVLAFFLEAVRKLRENTAFSWGDAVLFGLALGFSGPDSLPNDARTVALEAILFLALLVVYLVLLLGSGERRRGASATMLRVSFVAVPIGLLLLAYPFYVFLTSPTFGVSTVGTVAAAYAPQLSSGSYNTFSATLRLLGRRAFTATPYYPVYLVNPLVYGGTYLWPVLALFVPIVLALVYSFSDRWLVLPLAAASLAGTVWEAGTNPPLGNVYTTIVGYLPYGTTFFQPYSLTLIFLSKVFPVLMGFAVVVLARAAALAVFPPGPRSTVPAVARPFGPRWEAISDPSGRARPATSARLLALALVVALPVGAGFAALPVYNGAVEVDWVNPSEHGYFVPLEYTGVKEKLQSAHGAAVLLPELSTYVKTTWGFDGANGFYQNFFYPSQVLVPSFYGAYGDFVPSVIQNYTAATNPITAAPSTDRISSTFQVAALSTPQETGLRYQFHTTSGTLDLQPTLWSTITFPIHNATRLAQLNALGDIWIGLGFVSNTSKQQAWYALGGGSNAEFDALNATDLTVSIMPGIPSSGNVSTAAVNEVGIWLRGPVAGFGIVNGTADPIVDVGNASEIPATWLGQIESYGMSYLLVDTSLIGGTLQSYALVDAIVAALQSYGMLAPLHQGPDLDLYQIIAPPPNVAYVGGTAR